MCNECKFVVFFVVFGFSIHGRSVTGLEAVGGIVKCAVFFFTFANFDFTRAHVLLEMSGPTRANIPDVL